MEEIKLAMMNDKKVQKGALRFVVMANIGKSFVEDSVDSKLVNGTEINWGFLIRFCECRI